MTSKQWVPHERETWPWQLATLRRPVGFRTWHGHGASPEFTYRTEPAGTKVKIVMVSRLGDVGITTDLDAEYGYDARVDLDVLEPLKDAV
jgi:hypothetical protein